MTRPRLPLYGQILLWFFLNLALVAAVLLLVLKGQFQLDLRSVLTGRSADQFKAVAEVLSAELRNAPQGDWDGILGRYDEAYGVRFAVHQPSGDGHLAGEVGELPRELTEKQQRDFPRRDVGPPGRRPAGDEPGPGPGPGRFQEGPGPGPGGRPRGPGRGPDDRPFPRRDPARANPPGDGPPDRAAGANREARVFYVGKTGDPPRHWAAAMVSTGNREFRHQPDVLLVASTVDLGENGIFFDWRPWLWAPFGILLVSALIWFPFVGRVTRRLRHLTSAAESISAGDFDVEVATNRGDELGRLSRAVQSMAQRLDDYMAGQKRFLGDIAHELCSPLARLRMALGVLETRLPEENQESLAGLHEEAEELSQLVNELLDFSRASIAPAALPQNEIVLAELLEEIAQREAKGAVFKIDADPSLAVTTNRLLLRRALGNVVRNAYRYAGDAGPIELRATTSEEEIVLEVRDHGPGIPEEWLDRVFDPFSRPEQARTREGGGAGLGLAIAKTCAEGLGGRIAASNHPEGGLTVEVVLRGSLNEHEPI